MHGRMIEQLAEDLATIHRIAPGDVPRAPNMRGPAAGEDALVVAAARRRGGVPAGPAEPASGDRVGVSLARPRRSADWPAHGRPACVVHGDFRIGNMLYDERGLTSILDWEGVHIGEPEEDLAWFCTRVWRFGRNELEAGGIADARGLARARTSARAAGAVDRERVAAWEVLQNIRWCQITMMQARAHLDGHTNSHELAAIGRRTAETELEILRLTGVQERVRRAG